MRRRGELIAAALAGAWRPDPGTVSLGPNELRLVTPALLRTGAGALGWWRLRNSTLRDDPAALELQQAYRHHALQSALYEERLAQIVAALRDGGIEPLIARGAAAARLYPERGLRPYGDVDVWVRPDSHTAAARAVAALPRLAWLVDLHRRFRHLTRDWDELYERSETPQIGGETVRILGPEDHLGLMCLHMLYHGACRPLWLCDIGAALESLPAGFDWEYCLTGDSRHRRWITCAIGMAHRLLGARLPDPVGSAADRLPRWLLPAVLREWGRSKHYMQSPSMAFSLRHPAYAVEALRLRWPNPILATVGVGGSFDELPRLPFQLAECVSRATQFLAGLPGQPRYKAN
ncbi:MAG: nucleotidyltransferase family protein [Acidobacteria bacterium]|nr:nucleotidyltransferase family protein [Acidobacteriota bacterium]